MAFLFFNKLYFVHIVVEAVGMWENVKHFSK